MIILKKYNCIFLTCYLASTVLADGDILYSVVNPSPSSGIGVIVNNNVYPLEPSSESDILFQGSAPSSSEYSYAIIDESNQIISQEDFARPGVTTDTYNEFYGRSWNKKDLISFEKVPNIPQNIDRRSDENLHPNGEIPTIHVTAPQSSIDNLHDHYFQDIEVKANVTYIKPDSVKTFIDAQLKIGGRSTRLFTKFSYNLKLNKDSDDAIDGFKKFKLRAQVTDPSYMRDYIASEMMYAINQPASRGSFVRVFLNDRPVGLYTIMEKYDKTWLANEFAHGSGDYERGILYEGEGGLRTVNRASLAYLGDSPDAYSSAAYSISEKPKEGVESLDELVEFIKFIRDQTEFQKQATPEEISATVAEWNKRFEVQGFLASLAVEFMNGFWDNYLLNTNNYFMYKNPDDQKFYYITWDYDLSFGNGPVKMETLTVGDYRSYGGFDVQPLTVAIFNVPEFRALFESQLDSIVNNLYNPSQLTSVIDSVVDLIQDDVSWDRSLPHVRDGLEFGPNIIDNAKNHNFMKPDKNIGTPIVFSVKNSVDFFLRLNADVSFEKGVEGNTGHSSLYGLKEWFKVKLNNYRR